MTKLWKEMELLESFLIFPIGSGDFYTKAPLLAKADLAKIPYKKVLSRSRTSAEALLESYDKKKERALLKAFEQSDLLDIQNLKEFIDSSWNRRLIKVKKKNRNNESLIPYLFPTRPYSPAEIAELAPECVGLGKPKKELPAKIWAKYVRVLKGVWVKPILLDKVNEQPKETKKKSSDSLEINIGTESKKSVIVAITNLLTSDSSWEASACNKPNLNLERYKRISELVNQSIKLRPRPDYLLLPELSLPVKWVNSISNRLIGSGISLVAGMEYRHYGKKITNEACLELIDNRLGYPSSVRIWQPKLEPAVGEDKALTNRFGKIWSAPKSKKYRKPVYKHNNFHFGVMICAELQNSKERNMFQGEVDALMVLAWNKDLDTFSSLVEAAALDIHAYIIQVNNRKYGDSRVRAPRKESFKRDLARLRGGENDFCVTVELDIEKLRAFQSRAKKWPEETDPFKPTPGGFEISSVRKICPPK